MENHSEINGQRDSFARQCGRCSTGTWRAVQIPFAFHETPPKMKEGSIKQQIVKWIFSEQIPMGCSCRRVTYKFLFQMKSSFQNRSEIVVSKSIREIIFCIISSIIYIELCSLAHHLVSLSFLLILVEISEGRRKSFWEYQNRCCFHVLQILV